MNVYLNKFFFFILLLPFLSGCEKDVKHVTLPPFEQKLVIASFISPSDPVSYFFVRSNQRIYGELGPEETPGNLSGTISDGSREVELDTAKYGLQTIQDKMQIVYGKTYTINIISDKGLHASATCKIPMKREFFTTADTFSKPDVYGFAGERRIDVMLSITDVKGEENYYRIGGKGVGYVTNPNTGKRTIVSDVMRFEKEFFSDAGRDGEKFTVKTDYGLNYFYHHDSAFLEIFLYNTERSYYLYHKSLMNYHGDENFFREASPVFSNVTGGLGIFTSYTVDTLIFRLK